MTEPPSATGCRRRPMRVFRGGAAVALALAAAVAFAGKARAATVPAGFADRLVATLPAPTAIAFTPDGRILVTTQAGFLRVVQRDVLVSAPALDLSAKLCSNSERGLLGVAVDPSFAANRYVYLYYTYKKHGVCEANTSKAPVNRVSRFVLGADNVVNPATEVVLVDNIPSPNGNHNAGDLAFGKDGYLYVSVGDGGCDYAGGGCGGSNDAARDRNVLLGKILRITRDGAVPASNPFLGASTASCAATGRTTAGTICQETYAWGLRNPFRVAFDPNAAATRFYINDVGQNAWEEIDLGAPGADYGWNVREGHCANGSTTSCGAPPPGMTNPIYDYDHASSGCGSITGGAFVPAGLWPSAYDGAYLFGDFVCGTIFKLAAAAGGGYSRAPFATGADSVVHLAFGPWGPGRALYYAGYAGGGELRRIAYDVTAPTITPSITGTPGQGGWYVGPVTVRWALADPESGIASSSGCGAATITLDTPGTTLTCTATNGLGLTATRSVTVKIDQTKPTVAATAPCAGCLLRSVAFFVAWSGSDATSGIASYDVYYTAAPASTGVFAPYAGWLIATTSTSATFTGTPGNYYCFATRSRDRAGNVSAFASRCAVVPLDDRALSASAGWTRSTGSGYYVGTYSASASAGATLTSPTVKAQRLAVLVTKCPGCGTIEVRWNGASLGSFSLAATTTLKKQYVVLPLLPSSQTGTLVVRVVSSGMPVQIDGLAVRP